MTNNSIHAFSVDVEDWYQSSYNFDAPISELCVRNTRHVLGFLERLNVKGTFFVQGMVAKQYPQLIKEICTNGHEVQSHGYSHRPVYSLTPKAFKQELTETGRLIEDIIGKPVTGFRAPDFSIDKDNFWAFDVMVECGIKFDSSIFPLKTPRYGIEGFERGYSLIETTNGLLEELPVTVLQLKRPSGLRIPIGGGGYFRLFPAWFLRRCLKRIEKENMSFVIYCHPYEFNPQEWREMMKHVPVNRRLHQGIGRAGFEAKVAGLLQLSRFGTISDILQKNREKAGT